VTVVQGCVVVCASLALAGGTARAECPTAPDDDVCRPWAAVLLPTAFAVMYAPNAHGAPCYGGGLEAVTAWSDNSPAFGPSQGKLRFGAAVLRSEDASSGTMVMYRGGAQVSFERNASRRFLIPYFGVDLGALWTQQLGRRAFVDGGVGVYLVHRRALVIDLEVYGLLPFSDASQLGGARTQLSASFALW
jgi:hypothetical protein